MKTLLYLAAMVFFASSAHAQNINFEHDGLTRQYRIYIPNDLPELPACLFALHGYGGNNNEMKNDYGLTELADERGFVVVFPNGTQDQSNNRFWDVDYDFHPQFDIDDDGFLRELALHLQELHALDPNKTFVTGFSNGAEMCFQLACRESETFMAFAPIVGMMLNPLFTNCNPAAPRPMLSLNGTDDNVTFYGGDLNNSGGWGAYHSIPDMMELWADILGLTEIESTNLPDTNPNDGSTVKLDVYRSPNNGLEMWYYLVNGGGHDWPGLSGNMDINAAVEVVNFFERVSGSQCFGDVNDSGEVTVDDMLIVLSQFSNCTGECSGDLDSDGDVDVEDLLIIIGSWGATCQSSGACCIPDGTCQYITSVECENSEGAWNGELTSCTTTNCSNVAYDECIDAMPASNGYTAFSTADASISLDAYNDSMCGGTYLGILNADIWFTYEATCTGTLNVSTCDSVTFDTDLVVYEGSCSNKVQVACNGDDDNCDDYSSNLSFQATVGNTYLIRLGGWDASSSGTGNLFLNCN